MQIEVRVTLDPVMPDQRRVMEEGLEHIGYKWVDGGTKFKREKGNPKPVVVESDLTVVSEKLRCLVCGLEVTGENPFCGVHTREDLEQKYPGLNIRDIKVCEANPPWKGGV